jgi:putative membrane protein
MSYLLLKALHVMSVISWMAGLLYLYRLYVYHREEQEAAVQERFRVMERRLWLAITVPAAWATAVTGGVMVWMMGCALAPQGWLTAKLVLVALLLAAHFLAGHFRRAFARPPPYPLSSVAFRVLNEVPTLAMIGIVLLVELQPNWGRWGFCG